jgi:hypothetical protein
MGQGTCIAIYDKEEDDDDDDDDNDSSDNGESAQNVVSS